MRRRAGDDRLPHAAALVAGAILAASVFMPWYSPSLSEPFTPDPATGWTATIAARAVLVLALVVCATAGVLGLDRARQITLARPTLRLTGILAVGAATVAAALVLYRFVVLPDSTGLLARDWGIFIALAAAAIALLATVVLKFVEDD